MDFLYIIKKTISIFESPLIIVFFLLLLNIFLLKNKFKLFILNIIVFLFLFLFSYGPFVNYLSSNLENRIPSLKELPPDVEYIVLLGGEFDYKVYEIIRLYKSYENIKIVLFGRDSTYNFLYAKDKYNILLNSGIDKDKVQVFPKPKDTRSEIKEIKSFFNDKKIILVANAIHLPRIKLLCDKLNLNNIVFSPTNYFTKHKYSFYSIPSAEYLYQSKKVIHEYFGLFYEKYLI